MKLQQSYKAWLWVQLVQLTMATMLLGQRHARNCHMFNLRQQPMNQNSSSNNSNHNQQQQHKADL
jgi:hypothetical protein